MNVSVSVEFLRYVAASFAIDAALWSQNHGICPPHSGKILLHFMQDLGKGNLDEDLIDILRHLPHALSVRQEVAQWIQDSEHESRMQGFAFTSSVASVMAQILADRTLGPKTDLEEFAQAWSNEYEGPSGAVKLLEGLEDQYGSLTQAMKEVQEMPKYHA